jgi:hypothetical protein
MKLHSNSNSSPQENQGSSQRKKMDTTRMSQFLAATTATTWIDHDPPIPDNVFDFSQAVQKIGVYSALCTPIGAYLGFRDKYKTVLEDLGVHSSRKPTFRQIFNSNREVLLRATRSRGLQILTLVALYGITEHTAIYYRNEIVSPICLD